MFLVSPLSTCLAIGSGTWQPLRFNTLSVLFLFNILSTAQPTASLSPSARWLLPDRSSSTRLVLCSSDVNTSTATPLLISCCFKSNVSTDWLSIIKSSVVWSVKSFTFNFESFISLSFRALNNSIKCSGIMSLATHDIAPLSVFSSPTPRIISRPTMPRVGWVVTCWRSDTAQLPLSLLDPISSVTSDVFLVSPLVVCWAVGSITWQPLKFNTLSVLLTFSILSIAQPTASLPSPSASWLLPNRSSSSKLGLCSSDLNMWVATAMSRPQSRRVSTLSVLFTFSILSITQPTASLSPSASWLFSDKSSSSRLVLSSSDLNMLTALALPIWFERKVTLFTEQFRAKACSLVKLQPLKFNTLSVRFTFSIRSIAHPTTSQSRSVSWLFPVRLSSFRLVLCSSDLNMLTAPVLLIVKPINFNAWTDKLLASPTAKCLAVWSVRFFTISIDTCMPLSFSALKNSTQFSGVTSPMSSTAHHMVPLSIFTFLNPRIPTAILKVVDVCRRRDTAQLPLSLLDPISSVTSDVFLVSPLVICWAVGSITWQPLKFNTLSVLLTFSILSIAQPTASLSSSPSASWVLPNRSSSSKLGLCSSDLNMWVATAMSRPQLCRVSTLSVLFTFSILSIAQPTASLSPFASWLLPNRSSSSKLGLCSSDLNMWVATAMSRPQSHRVSTLSVLFTFSILSITQPTASLSPFASWLFSDKSSSSRLVLCSSDLNMLTALALPIWFESKVTFFTEQFRAKAFVKCSLVKLDPLKFNTLSVRFTFIILSIAHPTTSQSRSVSWLFPVRISSFRLVLCSSDLNMLTAPEFLIVEPINFNAWTDKLLASPTAKCLAVWSVRYFTISIDTCMPLSFSALKNSTQFSGVTSPMSSTAHHMVPLSIFTFLNPRIPTVILKVVDVCRRRDTAQLPLSLLDPISSVTSDVFLVSPLVICWAVGSITWQSLKFNTLSVLLTFSILSIAQPTASLSSSPSASWVLPNRSSSSKLGLCSSDLNMWVATAMSRPQLCRVSTLSVLFTFSILSIAQPTASLSPFASWLLPNRSSSSKLG